MRKQFLTFKLDNTQFAVEVHKVQEVLEYKHITRMPCAETYVEGLISSRGQGISVVNLRKKFALDDREADRETRIIVLEITTENGDMLIFGAIADSVQEVIDIDEKDIEPSPKFGNSIAAKFIHGIGRKDGEFIIILNIDQIFSTDEIINLEAAANALPELENEEENSETN